MSDRGVKSATLDADTITECWGVYPNAGIGIVTGRVSSLLVIDIDPGAGGDETLKQLEAVHGVLPRTIMCRTGSGGVHYYFKRPKTDGHFGFARHGLGKGVDLQAEGVQVLGPPTMHVSGARYEWQSDAAPGEVPLAELPSAWRRFLTTGSSSDKQSRGPTTQRSVAPPTAGALEPGESHGKGGES